MGAKSAENRATPPIGDGRARYRLRIGKPFPDSGPAGWKGEWVRRGDLPRPIRPPPPVLLGPPTD